MKKNLRVIGYSVIVAFGGLLFGLDTAVIAGAEKSIQLLYNLSDIRHGFTIAVCLIGSMVGAFSAGIPSERFGRKKILIAISVIFCLTSIFSGLAPNWHVLIVCRFLGGLAIGASSVLGPMYITEIAPAGIRGRLVAFFQFNISAGLLVAYSSNYMFSGIGDEGWRWMLGIVAVPSFIFFLLIFLIPESPRWLVKHNYIEEARNVFAVCGRIGIETEINDIVQSLNIKTVPIVEKLFMKKYYRPILYAVLISAFNQLTGTNVINYYAPRIFEETGLSQNISLFLPIFIGVTKVIVIFIGMTVIDKIGRRKLMIFGSIGLVLCLSVIAWSFYGKHFDGSIILFSLLGFMIFFGLSDGIVIWVFISEIFPNSIRSKGQSLASLTIWSFAVMISWLFPMAINSTVIGPGNIFMFFALMMFLQLLFAWKLMPETKGKSLEQIQKDLKIY